MVGGGNYVEHQNLQDYAKRASTPQVHEIRLTALGSYQRIHKGTSFYCVRIDGNSFWFTISPAGTTSEYVICMRSMKKVLQLSTLGQPPMGADIDAELD